MNPRTVTRPDLQSGAIDHSAIRPIVNRGRSAKLPEGLEPTTYGLQNRCSTIELRKREPFRETITIESRSPADKTKTRARRPPRTRVTDASLRAKVQPHDAAADRTELCFRYTLDCIPVIIMNLDITIEWRSSTHEPKSFVQPLHHRSVLSTTRLFNNRQNADAVVCSTRGCVSPR